MKKTIFSILILLLAVQLFAQIGTVSAGSDGEATLNNSYKLNATPVSNGTGYWTVISGNGIFSNSNSNTATVTELNQGSNIFRWTVNINGSISSSDVSITNNTVTPSASDQTIAGGTEVKTKRKQNMNDEEDSQMLGEKRELSVKIKPNNQQGNNNSQTNQPIINTQINNSNDVVRQKVKTSDNESYNKINENSFKSVKTDALSTFSIDVDKAAYANVRRYLNNGEKPPLDAVRIEEMINYFDYAYPQPKGEHPLAFISEYSDCPWNDNHKLLHIGLQGKTTDLSKLPASNIVFLIDVSGSMSDENKLPLLKSAFKILVANMRKQDKVAIVVYAGAAGVVLPATSGDQKNTINEALNNLQSGGSTAGGAGIELAYKIAVENFINNGNNRVVLATDGDFNVGASSDGDMERLIEEKRKTGVFLTCLGFGMGNYKDSKLEKLANKGNGNYGYIDNMQEANKMFGTEFGGTMFTIAKDVKFQIEFNPAKVKAYRLIGYEDRLLNNEDFNDDKKDAGELGSGHTVTALYEIIPAGVTSKYFKEVDSLKYQKNISSSNVTEVATIKLRYKKPAEDTSVKLEIPVNDSKVALKKTSENFRFASAVALFGMLLRNSEYVEKGNYDMVIELASNAKTKDDEGYRAEFVRLAKTVK